MHQENKGKYNTSNHNAFVRFLFAVDCFPNVVKGAADFFAGVQDIRRVKNIFCLLEKGDNIRSVHLEEVWCADDAVIVLGGDGAVIFVDEAVDFFRQIEDDVG